MTPTVHTYVYKRLSFKMILQNMSTMMECNIKPFVCMLLFVTTKAVFSLKNRNAEQHCAENIRDKFNNNFVALLVNMLRERLGLQINASWHTCPRGRIMQMVNIILKHAS